MSIIIPAFIQIAFKDFIDQCLIKSEGDSIDYDEIVLAFAIFIIEHHINVWNYIVNDFYPTEKSNIFDTIFMIQCVHPYFFRMLTIEYLTSDPILEISPDRYILLHHKLKWPKFSLKCITRFSGQSYICIH
jgi:hypothetical protein